MAYGITVDFTANVVKFASQLDSVEKRLNTFQAKAEQGAAKFNASMAKLGVGLSAAGLTAFVKSGIDAADALNDLADRSGIAVEKLAGLQYAVKIGDTTMEAFVASSNKLSINMAKNAEDFAALGISAKDPVEAFKQLADRFKNIDDPQKRAALGAATLGKSYAEMAPLLMHGADGIQALIDKGREHNGITTEQAKKAGEFNDKLDELANRSAAFRSSFAIGILEPLTMYGEEIDKAISKSGILMGTLEGLSNGFERITLSQLGTGGGLSQELDDINVKIAKAKQTLADNRTTKGDKAPVELQAEQTLNDLLNQRSKIIDDIQAKRSKTLTTTSAEVQAFDASLAKIIGGQEKLEQTTTQTAAKTKTAVDSLQSAYDSTIKSLEKEIYLHGENSAALNMEYEIQFGAFQTLNNQQALKLLNLAAEKDYIDANIKKWQEYDDVIEQGLQLASQQRQASDADFARLSNQYNGIDPNKQSQYDDAFQAKNMGIINGDQLARELERISGAGKQTTDQLSVFAEQGARNMQTAFADFLFNPFEQGMDGMLKSFADTIKRMAANAAAAKIMEALFGAAGSGSGALGGIVGSIFGAGGAAAGAGSAAGAIGGSVAFHTGGLVGRGGTPKSAPAALFSGAPRMHTGGFLKSDEVPAILQTGEMVLSRKQVAAMGSGSGGVQVNTTVTVNGPNNNPNDMQKLGGMINAKVREVIVNEKRAGGLLA